ncbi:glycoside hydrolase family 53 protein [Flammeovirga kamogawensis]|uniref:Arabinogalactan endo-beta-1,4-galactanase n=1 Tax=Flammeovirga kamogawensis TaxID=373891 RepID=A0ABX8H0P1_9BACT|nr:glycosyl hydrolase 53 family protein [Flammeovirga kamogawensis]MBB6462346.1 arabinogalactan endo-1,4-beta-galactosidase [Flammeovirga kamogawensis]QWG09460.1 arabinogalactan endo-1,4-beta-galactosidase [Flammeovirga kamogawensis]TRX64976.1 cellulase family glycosylhydrolase [Flammeovirga kamogawensis]
MNYKNLMISLFVTVLIMSCSEAKEITESIGEESLIPSDSTTENSFYFGADLSYVNQILDEGGQYKVDNRQENPYQIFADRGTNLVRLRLWHTPKWSQSLDNDQDAKLYSDLADVEKAMVEAKAKGMEVVLDFHYSDTWADPDKQHVPEAWKNIESLSVLSDSIYNYTFSTLTYLNSKGLMPSFVQIGNETNCGMMYTDASNTFPKCNVCDGNWANLKTVLSSAISAVHAVNDTALTTTKTILHVADPKNIEWWFENITSGDDAVNFDIIGISYYPIWHNTIAFNQMETTVKGIKSKFNKEVMIVEIAYPWTTEADDDYNNIFGYGDIVQGYPYTPEGHLNLMKSFTQSMINAGALGVIYWEPAWIAVPIKTLWGTGSSWENCAFFDYNGNATSIFDYMTYEYTGL